MSTCQVSVLRNQNTQCSCDEESLLVHKETVSSFCTDGCVPIGVTRTTLFIRCDLRHHVLIGLLGFGEVMNFWRTTNCN